MSGCDSLTHDIRHSKPFTVKFFSPLKEYCKWPCLISFLSLSLLQNKLNEEIDRLKEIKSIIEEQGADGQVQYPQWLVENGENLDALLDDAKKEVIF